MLRTFWLNAVTIPLLAVAGTWASGNAEAQVKPWKVVGGGPAPFGLSIDGIPSPHRARGVSTLLGRYRGRGAATVLTLDFATLSGTFKGRFTFRAANGDRLACTYGDTNNGADQDGEYQLIDVGGGEFVIVFIAEFNPIIGRSTGRFRKVVAGSLLMIAVTEPFDALTIDEDGFTPPFRYGWVGQGWLKFRK